MTVVLRMPQKQAGLLLLRMHQRQGKQPPKRLALRGSQCLDVSTISPRCWNTGLSSITHGACPIQYEACPPPP